MVLSAFPAESTATQSALDGQETDVRWWEPSMSLGALQLVATAGVLVTSTRPLLSTATQMEPVGSQETP